MMNIFFQLKTKIPLNLGKDNRSHSLQKKSFFPTKNRYTPQKNVTPKKTLVQKVTEKISMKNSHM